MSKLSNAVLASALMLSAAGFATPASAVTVEFDDFPESGLVPFDFRGPIVIESGFQFQSTLLVQPSNFAGYNADPDGHTLGNYFNGDTITITRVAPGPFDFYSFDVADIYNSATSGQIFIEWQYALGGTSGLFQGIDGAIGLQTVLLNLVGLDFLRITAQTDFTPFIQIDNVVLDRDLVSEVPLPAALPLFAAGLGAMGFMGWRKRRKSLIA